MSRISLRACVPFAMIVVLTAPVAAQEGHPLAGTWYGDYGSGNQRRDLTVIMKWDGRAVTGTVNPGPNAVKLAATMTITPGKPAPEGRDSTEGIPPVFHVRIEFDGITFQGDIKNPVAGNRTISGTWTRASEKGTFQIRRL
jgi:hypothetical protein